MNDYPIGVMDSGVGGLTVVKSIRSLLPHEDMIYIGDEKHCPYGPRSQSEVQSFVVDILNQLQQHQIKMFVIACNTATAAVLPALQEQVDIPIIGMIDNGSLAAVKATKSKQIAVLATEGTVKSHAYKRMIQDFDAEVTVREVACPQFVSLVENQQIKTEKAQMIIENLLADLKDTAIDTVILGCTHFPMLKDEIQSFLPDVTLIDAGLASAQQVEKVLADNEALRQGERVPLKLWTTGNCEHFQQIAKHWLPNEFDMDIKELK